jgi:hypothetical protein
MVASVGLHRKWLLNGKDLSEWTLLAGHLPEAGFSPRGGGLVVPGVSGEFVDRRFSGVDSRQIGFTLRPAGRTSEDYELLADRLWTLVGLPSLTLTQIRPRPGSRVGQRLVAPVRVVSFNQTAASRMGVWGEYSLVLKVPGVWFRDVDPVTCEVLSGPGGGLRGLSGGVGPIEDCVVSAASPITELVVRDVQSGSGFDWRGTVPSGCRLVVDVGAAAASVVDSGGVRVRDVTAGLSYPVAGLLRLTPDINRRVWVDVSALDAGGVVSPNMVEFVGRRCWK